MSSRSRFLTWNIERGTNGSRTGGGLLILLDGLWSSLQVAMLGLGIAIVLGFLLATLMSQATWVQNSVWPFLIALQAMPILAFVPLIGTVIGSNFRGSRDGLRDHRDLPDRREHPVRSPAASTRATTS